MKENVIQGHANAKRYRSEELNHSQLLKKAEDADLIDES
jgi:hypothetical protein